MSLIESSDQPPPKQQINKQQLQTHEQLLISLIPRDLPTNVSEQLCNQIQEIETRNITIKDLTNQVKKLNSDEIAEAHYALAIFCGYIRKEKAHLDNKMHTIFTLDILQYLLTLINRHSCPLIQFQVGWLINHVAGCSKRYADYFFANDGNKISFRLLKCESLTVKEQVAQSFAKFARIHNKILYQLVQAGAIQELIKLNMKQYEVNQKFSKICVEALANLYIARNIPETENIIQSISAFKYIVNNSKDPQILMQACIGLKYIGDDQRGRQLIIQEDVVPKLVQLLDNDNTASHVMGIIKNILKGNEEQIDYILLQPIHYEQLLEDKNTFTHINAYESLDLIASGTTKQIHQIIKDEALINYLLLSLNSNTQRWKKKLNSVFANVLQNCQLDDVVYLVEKGLISGLANQLNLFDETEDEDDEEQFSFLLLEIGLTLQYGEELKIENNINQYAEKFKLQENFLQNLNKGFEEKCFAIKSKIDDIKQYFNI